jgi:heme exporter protein C
MKTLAAWTLYVWIALVIVGGLVWAPPLKGFVAGGESSRIVFFHVPMAWTAFVAFITAGVASALYLRTRRPRHDVAAEAAVQLGLLFGVLATVTGAIWARLEWGAYWNWDPRQGSIVLALLFYAAYLALRSAVEDHEIRRRLAAGYAVLGLVVAPFLFFVAPRLASFSLHPEPVINQRGEVDMDPAILVVLLAGSLAFTALFFWMHNLQRRIVALRSGNEAHLAAGSES